MSSPEAVKAAAEKMETTEKKGQPKSFHQPGVNFSIDDLRQLELKRANESDDSFRKHVELALVYYYQNPQNDWDKKNAPKAEVLKAWQTDILAGKSSGGAGKAAKEQNDALKAELAALKAKYESLLAGKAAK